MLLQAPNAVLPANDRRRRLLLESPPSALNRTIYHYRHYAASSATYLARDDWYVPFEDGLFACYSFKQYSGTAVRTFGQTAECRPGLFTPAASSSRTGTWTTGTHDGVYVAGTPDTGGGTYYSSTVDGSTMTFNSTFSTGNALCLVIVPNGNNGYGIVSLNGNDTGAANLLPKVQAADIQSNGGQMLDADLGKTYIDFYGGTFLGDEHVAIAEGLKEDQQHSVVITCRNAKRTAVATGNTIRVAGLIACRRDSLPTTASHRMARMRKINDPNEALSACTIVVGWGPDANPVNMRLMGENHVGVDGGITLAETAGSLAITDAGGATVTPAAGTWHSSSAYTIQRVTTLTRNGTSICTKTVTYRFRSDTPMQLTAVGRVNFLTAGYLHNTLVGMLPALRMRNRYGSTYEKTDFDRGLVGDRFFTDVEWVSGPGREFRVKGADVIALCSTLHDSVYLMHMPRPDLSVDNWAHSGDQHTFLRAVAQPGGTPAPGQLKGYFARISDASANTDPQPMPAGGVLNFETGWRLMRIPRAANVLAA